MNKFLKWSGILLLVMLLVSVAAGGLLVNLAHEGLSQHGNWHVVVDGQDLGDLAEISFDNAGPGALIAASLALGFVIVFVIPLVLILGIGLPILAVLGALAMVGVALTGVSLLLVGPFLLPLLLIWLLVRPRRPAPPPTA